MILDSSAIIAILADEPDAATFAEALRASATNAMGAPTLVESSLVATPIGYPALDRLLAANEVDIVPFDAEMARAARDAHARYGRNSGSKARLNFGDCMSYALAKVRDEPLLFKGGDFSHTDITPAL